MTASRRLINLAGTLLVLIALVAGTMLTALPIYFESLELNGQERTVAQSNQLLQVQIDGLRSQEAEMPQVEQELAALDGQLPSIPQLDDATQLVVRAAGAARATITSVEFGEFATFAARDSLALVDKLPQTATAVTPPGTEPDTDEVNGNGAVTDGATDAPDDATASAGDAATPAPAADNDLQFPVTIVVTVVDHAGASRFLDELRAGPRLLQIDTATATTDDEEMTLTVSGLVFVSRNN